MKKSLVIALALMLVLAFATSAMAAQALVDGKYLSTATGVYYPSQSVETIMKENTPNTFQPDGTTNYPYEIYLPNEQSPDSYRIHTNYTKNTDACASCHATHTAVGESLLQWYSVYETCMACHDGTLGSATYNVQDGKVGATATAAFGGMFGAGSGFESNHNVTGALEIAAAPGGSTVETLVGTNKQWSPEFGCASCHTPHGLGGNARILHPDPNYVASARAKAAGYSVDGMVATETATPDVFAVTPGLTVDSATYAAYNSYYFLTSYPYALKVKVGATTYEAKDGVFTVSNAKGYTEVTLTGAAAAAKGDGVSFIGVPTMKVRMEIKDYLQATETVQHVSGMNAYCGACHTDYNTATSATYVASGYGAGTFRGSANVETGVFTQAHRHQVGYQWHAPGAPGLAFESGQMGDTAAASNKWGVECLTCHVAHGVSQDYWKATLVNPTVGWTDAEVEVGELAGSSALKRMPNMGTCEACHDKSTGAEGYNANAGFTTEPSGADNVKNSYVFDTAKLADFNTNYNAVTGLANSTKAFFTSSTGAGIFKNETFVGSAKCGECHGAYYDVWKAGDHVNAGGNAVDIVKRYDPTATLKWTDVANFNSKLVSYADMVAGYTKTSDSVATMVYNGITYDLTITGGNTITITDRATPANTATMKLSEIFIDGHAGEGFFYDTASGERYPLDRNFYMKKVDGEYVVTNEISPSFDMIELAEGVLEGVALDSAPSGCGACHTPKADATFAPGVMEPGVGCEACHGPGERHAAAPSSQNIFNPATDFAKVGMNAADSYKAQVNLCLACHSGSGTSHESTSNAADPGKNGYSIQKSATVGYAIASNPHYSSNLLTCTDCHDLHGSKNDAFIGYAKIETLCASCHDSIGAAAAGTVKTYLTTYSGTAYTGTVGSAGRVFATNNHGFPTNTLFNTTLYPVNQ